MNSMSSRLAAALSYPRAVDQWIELVQPLYSSHEIRARVVAVRRETVDVSTLVLEVNGRWPGHRPGQHVALTAEVRGVRRTRCFSVASAPSRRHVELTIKAQPGGVVTPHLVFELRAGTQVVLSPPQGDFILPEELPPRLLLLSGGSGITPLMSMLRALEPSDRAREMVFLHHARSSDDVIFGRELAASPFDVRVVTAPLTAEALAPFTTWPTWACGPSGFLDRTRAAYAAAGGEHLLHTERFSLAAGRDVGSRGEVTFVRSNRRADGERTLLVMAEGAGLSPQHGCRMGICRTCTCRKVSGVTRDVRTGELSTEADVDIQLCVHAPVGPVTIDI